MGCGSTKYMRCHIIATLFTTISGINLGVGDDIKSEEWLTVKEIIESSTRLGIHFWNN